MQPIDFRLDFGPNLSGSTKPQAPESLACGLLVLYYMRSLIVDETLRPLSYSRSQRLGGLPAATTHPAV